jgi:hypothetical protein
MTLDLITSLPLSDDFDAVMVIVDKLTKFALYIPTSGTMNQRDFVKLFVMRVARRYGMLVGMVTDRDPRWAQTFWESVANGLGLELMLSTLHHPQTDGQSERVIQHLTICL